MKENQIESCKIKKGVFAKVMLKLKLSSCQKSEKSKAAILRKLFVYFLDIFCLLDPTYEFSLRPIILNLSFMLILYVGIIMQDAVII